MSAESRAQAYESRIQDLQTLLKTARKAEAQAKKTEAAAIADLEALRNESSSACRAKDADLEALRLEHETLKMAHDSLKTSMKGKRTGNEYSSISVIEKDELSALNEKLRSASSVVSALTSKVEQQRVQLFETDAKCKAAEDRAAGLKNELEKLQQEHEEMINNAKVQTAADRKHVSLAKDQIARIVAKHNSFDKAWAAKQTQLENDLAESSRHVRELSITIQKKDQELGDLKQEILKKLWKSKSVESGTQTEKVPNKWLWLLTLKIAVMTDRDLQHEKEVQTDTVRIDGMVICFAYIFLSLQRFVVLSLVQRFVALKSKRQRSTCMLVM
jgi:chromosome segregation ATPase